MKKRNLLLTVLSTSVFTSCMIGCSNSNHHTIIFDTNGGTEIAPLNVKHNALVIEPDDPVKLPYGFTGWYTDKDYTNAFDFTQPVTQNLTLYAKWSNTIEFTYLYRNDIRFANYLSFQMLASTTDPFTETKIPLTIDWGDGETETYTNDEDLPPEYSFAHGYEKGKSGQTVYKVTIVGLVRSLCFYDALASCHFIQSVDVNELPYADIACTLALGSLDSDDNPSQVSKVTLPRNLSYIPEGTFINTSIKEFTIGKHVSTIKKEAFSEIATLKSIDFSKATSLRNIEEHAFYSCTKLNNIVFPETLMSIGREAFTDCDLLTTVTFTSKMPPVLDGAPFDSETIKTIYVPKGCKNIYISHWNEDYPLLVKKLVESE